MPDLTLTARAAIDLAQCLQPANPTTVWKCADIAGVFLLVPCCVAPTMGQHRNVGVDNEFHGFIAGSHGNCAERFRPQMDYWAFGPLPIPRRDLQMSTPGIRGLAARPGDFGWPSAPLFSPVPLVARADSACVEPLGRWINHATSEEYTAPQVQRTEFEPTVLVGAKS